MELRPLFADIFYMNIKISVYTQIIRNSTFKLVIGYSEKIAFRF